MTLNTSTKVLSFGAVAAAAAVLFSLSAHAGPNSAGPRCQGMSKEKVIKCCEQMIVHSSYRKIMGTSGRCEGAVVCARVKRGGDTYGLAVAGAGGSGGKYRCWLRKITRWQPNGDHRSHPGNNPNGRRDPRDNGPNGPAGGNQQPE